MAYLEIIRKGKKEYFYLTKNLRVGKNSWKKVRVYLGFKKPSNENIKQAAKKLEEKSKKVFVPEKYTYLTNADAEILQDIKEGFKEWLKRTPDSIKKKLHDDFVIRFTYNSNAIEGNRLTLRQTALVLKDRVIPSGVRADDYNEAINGKECLDFFKTYKGEINTSLLKKVNGILTKNTGVVYGGRIRFFNVHIEGSSLTPPKHEELKKHMLNLMKWYSTNKKVLHPFELAALLHAKIAWIHPFEDGNGRTARTIMNYVFLKKGFPMFFIPFEKREHYYAALELADKCLYKKYVEQMFRLILDQIKSYGHK